MFSINLIFLKNSWLTLAYGGIYYDRKEVTFLYKMAEGICPKSYGMNVARVAVRFFIIILIIIIISIPLSTLLC